MKTEGLQEQLDECADAELRKNAVKSVSTLRLFGSDLDAARYFDRPDTVPGSRIIVTLCDDSLNKEVLTIAQLCEKLPDIIVAEYGDDWRRFYTAQFISKVRDLQETFDDILTMEREWEDEPA